MNDTPIEDCYQIIAEIGSGSYGRVFKGRNKKTHEVVAIKQIYFQNNSASSSSLNEIQTINSIDSPFTIKLHEIIKSVKDRSLYFIFDYGDFDLYSITRECKKKGSVLAAHFMRQILYGLKACREAHILHRDLKPANIIVTRQNLIKITDFGLAKFYDGKPCTPRLGTLWYSAPELLLGATNYDYSVDMWSAGCIFYELFLDEVLFSTSSSRDFDQLLKISSICGTISSKTMKNFSSYSGHTMFRNSVLDQDESVNLSNHLKKRNLDPSQIELLCGMLALDPAERFTPDQALSCSFFQKYNSDSDLPSLNLPEFHHRPCLNYTSQLHEKVIDVHIERILPPSILA